MPTRSDTLDDEAAPRLEPQVRAFIVLLALLQGLALWLVHLGGENGWPLLDSLGPRVSWYTLVLSVPTAMALSVRRLDEARFWQHAALIGVVYLGLSLWAARAATGAPGLAEDRILAPFAASMAAALFVAGPFLQCRQEHGRWCAPYPELFAHAWQNALTLAVAAVFTAACWAVLGLWAGLFKLVGVDLFADIFTSRPFAYLGTGVIVGLGVLVGRSQSKPVRVMRRLLFAIFTGLFPLLAAIALLFVATLPFTGLEPLWGTRSAATVLMALVLAMVVFANAVHQDGDEPPPYPRPLRLLASAGLVVLPVFAVLALVALGLRIGQYGWTVDRLWGVLAASVLAVHAFGYAWAALSRSGAWLARLEPVNVTAALLGVALVLLANSPVLDPQRIAANSQVERLLDGKTDPEDFDVDYLRFQSGRAGYQALAGIVDEPRVRDDAELADRIERALARQHRWQPWMDAEPTIDSVEQARALVDPGPGTRGLVAGAVVRRPAGVDRLPATRQRLRGHRPRPRRRRRGRHAAVQLVRRLGRPLPAACARRGRRLGRHRPGRAAGRAAWWRGRGPAQGRGRHRAPALAGPGDRWTARAGRRAALTELVTGCAGGAPSHVRRLRGTAGSRCHAARAPSPGPPAPARPPGRAPCPRAGSAA